MEICKTFNVKNITKTTQSWKIIHDFLTLIKCTFHTNSFQYSVRTVFKKTLDVQTYLTFLLPKF